MLYVKNKKVFTARLMQDYTLSDETMMGDYERLDCQPARSH